MEQISRVVKLLIEELFPESDRDSAVNLLTNECGNNLPFLENNTVSQLDRYRFAAIKVSGGDISKLNEAVAQAKVDWRDLLMEAEFGPLEAADFWAKSQLKNKF